MIGVVGQNCLINFPQALSNIFEDEIESLEEEYGNENVAKDLVERYHSLMRFILPSSSGKTLTDAERVIARVNGNLVGVIDSILHHLMTRKIRVRKEPIPKSLPRREGTLKPLPLGRGWGGCGVAPYSPCFPKIRNCATQPLKPFILS